MTVESILCDVFVLLVAYQVKHFLCDYPLQTAYQLGKFKPGWAWVLPLTTHCSIHALGTFVIAFGFALYRDIGDCGWVLHVMLFDFVLHFCMDRVKASPNLLGRFNALSKNEFMDLYAYEQDHGEDETTRKLKRTMCSSGFLWGSIKPCII